MRAQIWSDGHRETALSRLSTFAHYEARGTPFAAKAWRRLGSWLREVSELEPYSLSRSAEVLDCFSRAIAEAPQSYKACHAWAMVHFEAVQQLPWAEGVQFVAPAVRMQIFALAFPARRITPVYDPDGITFKMTSALADD